MNIKDICGNAAEALLAQERMLQHYRKLWEETPEKDGDNYDPYWTVHVHPDEVDGLIRTLTQVAELCEILAENPQAAADLLQLHMSAEGGEGSNVAGPTPYATTDRAMSPDHNLGVQMRITRKTLKQSGAALEQAIRRDMSGAMGQEMDRAVFLGTGADGQPLGVISGAAKRRRIQLSAVGRLDRQSNATQRRGGSAAAISEGLSMGILDLFRRKPEPEETRSSGGGYTVQVMAARESYIRGAGGIGELTATVQSCVSLWEGAFALADVQGTDLLTRRDMALAARSAALRGEALFLITSRGLVPAVDWDLRTRDGIPTAYRLSLADAGGGRSVTALAAEVLHLRIGCDTAAPYIGSAPLRRASLTAGLMHTIESALAEVYEFAPIGSLVVPMPEMSETDMEKTARGFRGSRGRVLIRESVNVSAAGGPAPQQDWTPRDLSPDLERTMTKESLAAARDAICGVYGVLPALFDRSTQGPLVREAQRHLAGWTLQPIAMLLAEEATQKLGTPVMIDTMRPVQAYDVGGRARALSTIIEAFAKAKELNLSPEEVNAALTHVNWGENDGAA